MKYVICVVSIGAKFSRDAFYSVSRIVPLIMERQQHSESVALNQQRLHVGHVPTVCVLVNPFI